MSKIKICGLYRPCDIDYVNQALPDYAGFIIHFPKSHRSVEKEEAKRLIQKLDSRISAVCVFVNAPVEYVASFASICKVIQLHGEETNSYIKELRKEMPGKEIWKAIQVHSKEDLEKANASVCDRILLDNGYGTGVCFDWSLIGGIKREYILAGGLNMDNMGQAMHPYSPYCFDISSGVETNKEKDPEKIRQIVNLVKKGR